MKETPTLYQHLYESPVGWIAMLASERGMRRISLQGEARDAHFGLGPEAESALADPSRFAEATSALDAYFAGDPSALGRISADLAAASPFYNAAWQACSTIPAGETRTYQWLAEAAGNPRASRAAGQAMAKNPLPLVIPCHRVVGSGGRLHGYGGGGVGVKARLLELERQQRSLL